MGSRAMSDELENLKQIISLFKRWLHTQTRFAEMIEEDRQWRIENSALGGELTDYCDDFIFEWS